MSRRHSAEKREVNPDPKYSDLVLTKFMNAVMSDGKKSVAERIVYGALERVEQKAKSDPVALFHQALDNVMPAVFAYEVSGKPVLRQWFSCRRRDRTRPVIGDRRPPSPLDAIQPESWLPEYTTDLMNLLHVLGRLVLLEDAQAALLQKVLDGMLIPVERLGGSADDGDDSPPA